MNMARCVNVDQWSIGAAQDHLHGIAVFLGDAQKNCRSVDDLQVCWHRDAPYLKLARPLMEE
jgi:hypothetical protein